MKEGKIPVYAVNLTSRADRKASVLKQFSDKFEFALNVVPAIEHERGAWGLWQTFRQIVEDEAASESEFFVFCEDDHVFTAEYSFPIFKECIEEAEKYGADILSGGMSWYLTPVQVCANMFRVEAFNGMQFTVIFKRFYSAILAFGAEDGCVLDQRLSQISQNLYVMYPYISVQRDFGYSDVTSQNNTPGRVPQLFENMQCRLRSLDSVLHFYKKAPGFKTDCPLNLEEMTIPAYVIHLPERREREESIREQFSKRTEFELHIVEACRDGVGATGLWKSIRSIVAKAEAAAEDVILICEDDHVFTPAYDKTRFLLQVWRAGMASSDILVGGIGGFGDFVHLGNELYWTDWFWCTQFVVIFRRAFIPILQAKFQSEDTADGILSSILPNKLVTYPFISIQKDFGYSDVTKANNQPGKITSYFIQAHEKASKYRLLTMMGREVDGHGQIPGEMQAYLDISQVKGLNIGCGGNMLPGWLNTDIKPQPGAYYMDAAQNFPLPDAVFDYVFSEHLLEHLSYEEGQRMLQECFRVLKPGGILRLSVPTLDFLMRLYEDPDTPLHQKYITWSLKQYAPAMYKDWHAENVCLSRTLVVNNFMRFWGHKMLYDCRLLKHLLTRQGFEEIEEKEVGKSDKPFLCDIECHGRVIPQWANLLETMTIEAVRPYTK